MNALRTFVQLLPAGVFLFSLPACTYQCDSTARIDAADVEAQLRQSFVEQLGVTPTKVECPKGVEARAGEQLVCRVTLADTSVHEVTVEMTSADTIQWRYDVLRGSDFEPELRAWAENEAGMEIAQLTCPLLVKKDPRGTTSFECTMEPATGTKTTLSVVHSDHDSTVTWSVKE